MESQGKNQKVRVQRMIAMMAMMVENGRRRGNQRVAAAAQVAFLQKQVDSLQQKLEMEKVNSASSLSSGSNASKCVVALKLTDVHRSQMKLFRDAHGWSRIKFIPNADFYVRNPTTLTALFKCLLIETEEDKVKYSEDLQREYSDETNRKRHNVKNAVRSKYKSE